MLLYFITSAAKISFIFMVIGIIFILTLVTYFYYNYRAFNARNKALNDEIERQKEIANKHLAKLSKVEASKAVMFKNLMEEIQAPLSSIVGFNRAIMLEHYGNANTNIKGASRLAVENGKQLLQIVEEVLELASFEKKLLKLDNKPIRFYPCVYSLYIDLVQEAKLKNIHIGFNYQLEKNLHISLDMEKFKQVFKKLVRNAIQCSPQNSQVIISLKVAKTGDKIDLIVEDSGAGLNQYEPQHIFDAYFQSEHKKAFHVYGIIPTLLRNYADLFNADLSITSAEDRGTSFTFSFPLHIVKVAHKTHIINENTSQNNQRQLSDYAYNPLGSSTQTDCHKKYRGLIVSNDEHLLDSLNRCLEESYHTIFARKNREVQDLLNKYNRKIDFIICAGTLPFMNEFQLLCEVKSNEKWNKLPLLVVTDNIKASLRIRSFSMGIDDYLIAPFNTNELVDSIEKLLYLRTERDEWHVRKTTHRKKDFQITNTDLAWLTKLEETIQDELRNRRFNLGELAYRMATSERQLFRKVKELTGKTPNKYLREFRIYSAKKLLENYSYNTVAEVSYAVGFQDPHYFSKIYKARFDKWPSEYLQKAQAVS